MNKDQLIGAALDDDRLIEAFIPGKSPLINQARFQIKSFARNTSAKSALLIGPIGSGKSTIARIMAFMRYLYYCKDEKREQLVENLQSDGPFRIDKKLLDFYEELNLSGLVSQLAQAQLFGVAHLVATGVSKRPGIFEQAMTGHSRRGTERTIAAQMTGGVVFLDEIGDLSPELQPLLLSVLTGAEVFRVGGEGNPDYGYQFNGSVIAATWKRLSECNLRPDLLSRLRDYVIELPGLNDRRNELEIIAMDMSKDIRKSHLASLERLKTITPDYISRQKLKDERNRELKLDQKSIEILNEQDWDGLGNLRGLRQILQRCFYDGLSIAEALRITAQHEYFKIPSSSHMLAKLIIENITSGTGLINLSEEIIRIEKKAREELLHILRSDPSLLHKVVERTGLTEKALKRQLSDLKRDRSKKNEA